MGQSTEMVNDYLDDYELSMPWLKRVDNRTLDGKKGDNSTFCISGSFDDDHHTDK